MSDKKDQKQKARKAENKRLAKRLRNVDLLKRISQRPGSLPESALIQGPISDLRELASDLKQLAKSIRAGSGAAVANDLATVADKLTGAADAYNYVATSIPRPLPELDVGEAGDYVTNVNQVFKSVTMLSSLKDSQALEQFRLNPDSPEAAHAWAADVCRTFDASAQLVDSLPIDIPYVSDMLAGYLGAPKSYLRAFMKHLGVKQARIAEQTLTEDYEGDILKIGTKTLMKGPLTRFYDHLNARGVEKELRDLMSENKNGLSKEGMTLAQAVEALIEKVWQESSLDGAEQLRLQNMIQDHFGIDVGDRYDKDNAINPDTIPGLHQLLKFSAVPGGAADGESAAAEPGGLFDSGLPGAGEGFETGVGGGGAVHVASTTSAEGTEPEAGTAGAGDHSPVGGDRSVTDSSDNEAAEEADDPFDLGESHGADQADMVAQSSEGDELSDLSSESDGSEVGEAEEAEDVADIA